MPTLVNVGKLHSVHLKHLYIGLGSLVLCFCLCIFIRLQLDIGDWGGRSLFFIRTFTSYLSLCTRIYIYIDFSTHVFCFLYILLGSCPCMLEAVQDYALLLHALAIIFRGSCPKKWMAALGQSLYHGSTSFLACLVCRKSSLVFFYIRLRGTGRNILEKSLVGFLAGAVVLEISCS